ncbi:MAG: HAD family phosphatase [Lachnospiraceae bacterium]|nr:HAD family phosphatase [Lachnospiraceae bacterium]
MKRKFVIFDMDGVILDSEVGGFSFLQQNLSKRGIHIGIEELLKKVGKNSYKIAEEIIKEYNIDETVDEFLEKNRKNGSYYTNCKELKTMDGLNELITILNKREIKLAVVSSTRAVSVLTALNRLKIVPHLNAIVSGDMVRNSKPDPEGYLMAADFLGAQPEECVVFEDSPIGIRAAKNAGMRVIGYKGSDLWQDTSAADMECSSYRESIDKLEMILEG